jgi:ssDNA-binding Zn-finger/Zn-ribbon topoisomerase 1
MNENEVKKCPKCGGELEKSIILAYLHRGGIAFWGKENIEEKLVSQWFWQDMRDLPAWRCKKCQLAVFLYGENKGVKP